MNKIFLLLLTFFLYSGIQAQISGKARINHLAYYIADLNKGTIFYRDIVGLDTIPNPFNDGAHTWFLIDKNIQLHLISGPNAVFEKNKGNHLCLSIDDLPAFIKRLEANKVKYEDWEGNPSQVTKRVDGVHQIYLKDPDGYWLEINDARD